MKFLLKNRPSWGGRQQLQRLQHFRRSSTRLIGRAARTLRRPYSHLRAAGLGFVALGALPLVMAGIFGLSAFEAALSPALNDIHEARRAFAEARLVTQSRLVQALRSLERDSPLQKNLDWRLINSVEGLMAGFLRPGELDGIWILQGGACTKVAHAARGGLDSATLGVMARTAESVCRTATVVKSGALGLSWPAPEDTKNHDANTMPDPYQWAVIPLRQAGSEPMVLLGLVHLDSSWREGSVGLEESFASLKPELVPFEKGWTLGLGAMQRDLLGAMPLPLVAHPGGDQDAKTDLTGVTGMAWITSSSWHKTAALLAPAAGLATSARWFLLIVSLALCSVALVMTWRNRYAADGAAQTMERWVIQKWDSIQSGAKADTSGHGATSMDVKRDWPLPWQDLAHTLQAQSDALEKRLLDTANEWQRRDKAHQDKESAQAAEIRKLRSMRASHLHAEALTTVVVLTKGEADARSARLYEQLEDLGLGIQQEMRRAAQELLGLVHGWQRGVQERGARKFIRSLSETAATPRGTGTQLDEQIAALAELAGAMDSLAAHGTMYADKIRALTDQALDLPKLWQQLSSASGKAEGSSQRPSSAPPRTAPASIEREILHAQDLAAIAVSARGVRATIPFVNAFKAPAAAADGFSLSDATRVVGFMHVFLGFLHRVGDQGFAQLTVRVRRSDRDFLIAVSAGPASDVPRIKPDADAIDMGLSLLDLGGLKGTLLPTPEGTWVFAAHWKNDEKSLPTVSSSHDQAELDGN